MDIKQLYQLVASRGANLDIVFNSVGRMTLRIKKWIDIGNKHYMPGVDVKMDIDIFSKEYDDLESIVMKNLDEVNKKAEILKKSYQKEKIVNDFR